MNRANKRELILKTAKAYIQREGSKSLSFKTLAKELGISHPTIHHYFPTKTELCQAVLNQYHQDFLAYLEWVQKGSEHEQEQMNKFLNLFESTFEDSTKVCLCSVFALEIEKMDKKEQALLKNLILDMENWLYFLIQTGQRNKLFLCQNDPRQLAKHIIYLVEGGLIFSRVFKSQERLTEALKLVESLLQFRPL